jgi:rare lipoprotein A
MAGALVALAGALLALGACARAVVVAPPGPPRVGAEETGSASWYGHPYHGRRTASGEVYDMHDLTAAHRSLPLGTRLLVTSLDSDRVVEVRVNDRGPWVDGRILDLSYAAAQVLGAVRPGIIPVRLRVIGLPDEAGARAAPAGFVVQVGAFTSRARAESLRETLAREGSEAIIAPAVLGDETYYRVRVGAYADRAAARAAAERLAARGHRPVVVER